MDSQSPAKSLNVFALPTRTTLLFSLIALVIALPVAASLGDGSPIFGPFLVFWMIVLPLRAFLRHPTVQLRQRVQMDPQERHPFLVQRWNQLAEAVAKIKPPRLVLESRAHAEPHTFGTFTRRYMALPETLAPGLESALESQSEAERKNGEAVLLHELAHFRHHDVWMTFFAQSLLHVTIAFMTLNFLVNSLTPWFYNNAITFFDFNKLIPPELIQLFSETNPQMAQVLVSPPTVAPGVWANYEVFLFTAHWPLVLGSIILLVFYWRALLRTRELYADARVAEWQKSARGLWGGLSLAQILQIEISNRGKLGEALARWRARLPAIEVPGWRTVIRWFAVHPYMETRREVLREPYKIYGSDWAIALVAGVTIVLINLTLGSLFLSRYIRGPNSAAPFLVGFSVLSLSLLPYLCQFPQRRRDYSRKIFWTVSIFTVIKLIPQYLLALVVTIGFFVDPTLIDQAAYALVPGAGVNPPPTGIPIEFVLEQFVIRPALLFTFVMPILLMILLFLDAKIKRRILRWYSARFVVQHPARTFLAVTALLAAFLGLMVIPVLDWVTNPTAHDLFDPLTLCGMAVGAVGLVAAIVLFFLWDRRHADRCPNCGARAEGEYSLGKSCAACGGVFHPRLLAEDSG